MKKLYPGACPADLFDQIASFPALLAASARAALGKRNRRDASAFLQGQERHLLALSDALRAGLWLPGSYRTVTLHEPKRRFISVAPFADRVVHQAVAAVVQPILVRSYNTDTYASLAGRGQHACVRRFEQFRDRHAWVLRLDMYRYFPSLDQVAARWLAPPAASQCQPRGGPPGRLPGRLC